MSDRVPNLHFAFLYLLIFGSALVQGCLSDLDCQDYEACFPAEGQCGDLRLMCNSTTYCGEQATCRVKNHEVICVCKQAVQGTIDHPCVLEQDCKTHFDCPLDRMCSSNHCEDPCKFMSCGENSVCETTNHFNTMCKCTTGYRRADLNYTTSVCAKCHVNGHCPGNKICVSGKCEDLCKVHLCGSNSVCKINNNQLSCSCKEGYKRVDSANLVSSCQRSETLVHCPLPKGSDNWNPFSTTPVTNIKYRYIFSRPDHTENWHKARETCESFGLEFASVTSASELEEFKVAFKATVGRHIPDMTTSYFWLGGSDLATRGSFTWTTLPPQKFLYTYWKADQPDNTKWKSSEGERCLLGHAGQDYFWNDYPCDEEYQYVCKAKF